MAGVKARKALDSSTDERRRRNLKKELRRVKGRSDALTRIDYNDGDTKALAHRISVSVRDRLVRSCDEEGRSDIDWNGEAKMLEVRLMNHNGYSENGAPSDAAGVESSELSRGLTQIFCIAQRDRTKRPAYMSVYKIMAMEYASSVMLKQWIETQDADAKLREAGVRKRSNFRSAAAALQEQHERIVGRPNREIARLLQVIDIEPRPRRSKRRREPGTDFMNSLKGPLRELGFRGPKLHELLGRLASDFFDVPLDPAENIRTRLARY